MAVKHVVKQHPLCQMDNLEPHLKNANKVNEASVPPHTIFCTLQPMHMKKNPKYIKIFFFFGTK